MTTRKTNNIRKEKSNLSKLTGLKKRTDAEFWENKTFEELTEEQGVKPFSVEENGNNWPKGADFEELMSAINTGKMNAG